MTTEPARDPGSVNELRRRVTNLAAARNTTVKRLQALVANVIVGQMLPDTAIKGGTGLKLRFGDTLTRETPDLDTAFLGDLNEFRESFERNGAEGWGPFTARIVQGRKRAPDHVPAAYVMQPFTVKLNYRNKPFGTVTVEVGYDELEATTDEAPEIVASTEAAEIFAALGLPEPGPLRVLPLHHQVAQKIHACSEPGSDRAHDLVDLQIMTPDLDDRLVAETCRRLFAFRQLHAWPPIITPAGDWAPAYEDAAFGLDVLAGVGEAIAWANDYIARLAAEPTASGRVKNRPES